ncbi:MAG: hypothetical protein Q9195_008071 [Heterodermia aff. obscurata]
MAIVARVLVALLGKRTLLGVVLLILDVCAIARSLPPPSTLSQESRVEVIASNNTFQNGTTAASLGDPSDPLVIRIHEYEGVLFQFLNYDEPSVESRRMVPFYSYALQALQNAQGTLQPFDTIPGNRFGYTDRHHPPSLTLNLWGVNGHEWGLSYEDVEEVIHALRVYARQWAPHGSRPKSTEIRVFRNGPRVSSYGVFEVGLGTTDRQVNITLQTKLGDTKRLTRGPW